jgi:hypothetical protein
MAAIFSRLHFLSSLPKINASVRIEFSLFRKDLKESVTLVVIKPTVTATTVSRWRAANNTLFDEIGKQVRGLIPCRKHRLTGQSVWLIVCHF